MVSMSSLSAISGYLDFNHRYNLVGTHISHDAGLFCTDTMLRLKIPHSPGIEPTLHPIVRV